MLCSNDVDNERICTYFLNNNKKLIVTGRSVEENNKIN